MTKDGGPLDLEAIEARVNAVPPGRWGTCDISLNEQWRVHETVGSLHDRKRIADPAPFRTDTERRAIGAFIAHSRTDIPALLSALRASEARVGELTEALEAMCAATKKRFPRDDITTSTLYHDAWATAQSALKGATDAKD